MASPFAHRPVLRHDAAGSPVWPGTSGKARQPPALLPDADIPVRGTEAERSEAQEAEASEEALKALAVHDPYTLLPLPVFHYDRNESYGVGAVLPVLESNSNRDLQHIDAPFDSHHRYIEETFGLYYSGSSPWCVGKRSAGNGISGG